MVTRGCRVGEVLVDKTRVPSIFLEGALMLQRLATRGVLQDIAERVRVRRQGGFCGVDGLVFLVLYFTGCAGQKLRAVDGMCEDAKVRLGDLAARDRVMYQSSLSRLLAAVDKGEASTFIHWLLLEASGVKVALQSAIAQVVDVQGVPTLVLWNETDKYFKLHHKASDSFDAVNQADLNQGAATTAATAYAIADSTQGFAAHNTPAEVEEFLRKVSQWDEYQFYKSIGIMP